MLIRSAEFIQVPEAVSSTFVRFELLEKALSLIPYAPYGSSVAGFETLGVRRDGEVVRPTSFDALSVKELVDNVIEGCTQVGECISNDRVERERDVFPNPEAEVPSPRFIKLIVGHDFVGASAEGDPLGGELTDVMFCPFDLGGYTSEAISHEASSTGYERQRLGAILAALPYICV